MSENNTSLFEAPFTISDVNSQKYDRVSRISATSTTGDMTMQLDVNTEIYPCGVGDTVLVCLASTLALDGGKDDGKLWREIAKGEPTLADHFDYVCHGKVYRFEDPDIETM